MVRMPETRDKTGLLLLGVFLLAVGMLTLLGRVGIIDLNFDRIFAFMILIIGGFEAITAFASFSRGTLFWGSSLFLAGLLVLLISYGFVPGYRDAIWPAVLVIPGFSFLMLYLSKPHEYLLAVVGALFIAAGWIGIQMPNGGFGFGHHFFSSMRILLAAAIVLTGAYLLWRSRSGRHG